MVRQRVSIIGRVQGVGFRATARRLAERFPVVGWVRNEPDGSVVLEVQGLEPEIEAFLGSLRAEMGRYIRSSDAIQVPLDSEEDSFEIRR